MSFREEIDIFLSQLLSGMFLFKREVSDKELCDVISMLFNTLDCDVYDDECYNKLYDFIDNDGMSLKIKNSYNYDTLLEVNGKKISFYNFLLSNTNERIMEFLKNNIYQQQLKFENVGIRKELSFFNYINNFLKEKKSNSKKRVKIKHETGLI